MSNTKKYGLAFILALSLHFSIMGLFAFNFISEPTSTPKIKAEVPEIIEASILDENVVAEKAKELQQAEENKQIQQQQQKDQFAEQLKQEKLRIEQAKTKRLEVEKTAKIEAQRLQEVANNEAKKLAAIKQAVVLEKQKQEAIKQKRIAEEQAQAAEKKRKLEAERVAEAQRKAEAEKQEVARKEAEKQQKIAEEKQRQEELARQKEAAAKQAEENRVRAENARIAEKATADAKVLIERKVTQNWNRPSTVSGKLACTIRVGLIPSGDVMSVVVVKSSGNQLFDDSAERAVFKASPLPVPKDPKVFSKFRSFTFVFSPN
ncbi:MAG: cell envelope integrity protein TolA [Methyloprofundus sp.]|nr:cell envelope integrity protein TolA [Methyloprofundus sp.]